MLQPSTTAGTSGIFVRHSGAIAGTGYSLWAEKTGVSTTNIAGYFTATGGTNNYALIVPNLGGNVGIGTTTPNASALLDVSSTTKGVLLPKVALSATNNNAPIGAGVATGLIVYNTATAGVFPNDVTPGYYWWNGQWERFSSNPKPAWYTTGNTGTNPAQYFLGTIDAQPIAIRSNNVERMRITPVGEVIIGGTAPVLSGDLFIASSLAGYDWPINGYSFNDGGAFYGDIRAGNATDMSVMELEHDGSGDGSALLGVNSSTSTSATAGTGVYGESSLGHDGSNYYSNNYAGIYGSGAWSTDRFSFGVVGLVNGTGKRQGGVMGTWSTTDWGALGYKNNAGTIYGLCYVGGSTTIAKGTNNIATDIGMGGFGDLMGGWVRGNVYGLNISGGRYSLYLHGKQFTNDIITILSDIPSSNERIPTYVPASMTVDVYAKGLATIVNGEANISFNKEFRDVISDTDPVIVTVTPIGRSANLYIDNSSKVGFRIIDASPTELKSQALSFTWIAIGTRKGYENPQNPPELLKKTYESNMDAVMFNESDTLHSASPIWWDGTTLRFDTPPASSKTQGISKADAKNFIYRKSFETNNSGFQLKK